MDGSQYYDAAKKIFYPLTGIRPLTPDYMPIAHHQPVKLDTPKKLLVILDLNGTLFYSDDDNYKSRTYTKRPYFVQLLLFLYANCRVMVWSSATHQRVSSMVAAGGFMGIDKMDRIWNREHLQLHPKDFYRKVLTLKDLEFVWREIESEKSCANPDQLLAGGKYEFQFDQTNTILIDDSPHKSQLQPYNCMIVPDFDKTRMQKGNDIELLKVVHYIKGLLYQDNVSAYMRTCPFDTNNKFYLSSQFRRETTVEAKLPRGIAKKARKRDAKNAALDQAKQEMVIEHVESWRLRTAQERERRRTDEDREMEKAQEREICWTDEDREMEKTQESEGCWTEEDREIQEARAAEMFLAARMAKVAGLPMERRTPAQRALPDWVVPTWEQQGLYRNDWQEAMDEARCDSTGVENDDEPEARPSGMTRSRTLYRKAELTSSTAHLGPIRSEKREPSSHFKGW
ncbi:hypothetical protein BGZ95_009550 [Linnemannia exigua]|uniref:Mitochondrial import inner membrane translocase subunit TIM50 n=1 Tax=Linnemannia exigua TaxID=604196 RepID=A0AAD4H6J7_9FUNG|nr:hypothetical protein BGZ95_009550 [Linnemannia exigua]